MANEDEIQSMKDFDNVAKQPLAHDAESVVERVAMPDDQMYYGGKPPLRGARRPKGYTRVDEFGNEIDNPFETPKKKDITQMPGFIEAFGAETASAIGRSSKNNVNNEVKIVHGESKPVENTARVDPHMISPTVKNT
jgi:hypothetical protein